MKIVVLAGGRSPEREVSMSTGAMVCRALKQAGHQTVLIDAVKNYQLAESGSAFEKLLRNSDIGCVIGESAPDPGAEGGMEAPFFGEGVLELCRQSDCVFMALHGAEGENGKVQAVFDLFGIPYTGSGSLASALAMNKKVTKQIFQAEGIPTPAYYTLSAYCPDARFYPCVVKPLNGGSSIGVSIVHEKDEWEQALRLAFRYEKEVLVEQFVKGREFSVGVLMGEALPVIEITPKEGFYNYKNKYQPDKTLEECPARISQELTVRLMDCALWAAKALEVKPYGRVDFLVDNTGEVYCLEVNTLPGMTPTSLLPQEARAAGTSFEKLCDLLVGQAVTAKSGQNQGTNREKASLSYAIL